MNGEENERVATGEPDKSGEVLKPKGNLVLEAGGGPIK